MKNMKVLLNKTKKGRIGMKWNNLSLEEQETLINFDYYEKKVSVFTSRGTVYKKLLKKLGLPTRTNKIEGFLCDAEWIIPFKERNMISKVLTLNNLLMTKERE